LAPDKPLDSAVLSRMKQFSAMNKLKKMALRVSRLVLKELFHTPLFCALVLDLSYHRLALVLMRPVNTCCMAIWLMQDALQIHAKQKEILNGNPSKCMVELNAVPAEESSQTRPLCPDI